MRVSEHLKLISFCEQTEKLPGVCYPQLLIYFFCNSKKKCQANCWFYWSRVIWKLLRVLAWPAVVFSRKHGLLWLQCARKESNGWPLWGQLCLLQPGGKDLQLKYQLLWYCKAYRASATSTEAMEAHVHVYVSSPQLCISSNIVTVCLCVYTWCIGVEIFCK